jgi:tetratricopeptide (TPR) repeat protein
MARGTTAGGAGERPKCLNTRRSTGPKSAVMTTQSAIRNRYGILAAVDRRPVLQRRWRWAPAVAPLLGAVLLWAQKDIDVRAHLERAEQALQRSDPETARKELLEAVRLNPSSGEAHARLGIVYRKLGMAAQAAESLERAVRLEPDPRVKVLLAFSYKESGRYRDAIPLLEASFESEQKDSLRSVVGQHLVECHLAVGATEQALAVVQKLRQIAPDDPGVLYLSSKVYLTLWNGAFQRMMAKAPDSYQVHLIRAEALEAQEKFAEAAGEYRQVLKIAPQTAGIHYRLARMILRSGASADADQEALAEFRKELEINPGDVHAIAGVGEIHLSRNRLEEAARSFQQAVSLQPGYVPARVGLAKVLIAEKQWSNALEHLEAASKQAPDEEAVVYNLMIVYRGLGRSDDARRAFDQFQRLKEQSRPKVTPPQ